MEKEIKYYVGSDGVAKDITTLDTMHLLNAFNKKFKEIFMTNKIDDAKELSNILVDLQNELAKRFNEQIKNIGE